ncbi:MAG: pseudaminic acid synthase [Lachnospiraceae bacterium]|nr:pseudaminic acid synthase [Lachnospiraceae bacterium]
MSDTFNINGRTVGDGNPAYIIAEMSANHAGSIERALELIHVAKEAGADCVKIQTYTPDTMTIDCRNEYFQIEKGTWEGDNLYSLYQKAYTPWEWQEQLRDEAAKVGIDFLSTPFDHTSVDFLENLGVGFYKIASFELVDIPLLEYIASKKKPIIMSTAMGTLEEINEAVEAVYRTGNKQLALMKCSSAYPAKSEEMNLSTIRDLKARFDIPVGLSDHSMGYFGAATAVAMGANIIEKHFCISRAIKNPDSSFSMEPEEFREMVCQVREVEKAMGKVYYGVSKQEESNTCFRRSLFVVKDIAAGEAFTPENIRSIRPAYGLKPKYYKEVLGKTAKRELKRGTPLAFEDIDGMEEYQS